MNDIRHFLIEANRQGYGNTDVVPKLEADGSHTIVYEDGEWKLHDNYFGGEPYAGREIISKSGKALWCMVYYGWVEKPELTAEVYAFLKSALMQAPEDAPYRGPALLEAGDWRYENAVQGEFERFTGVEQIFYKNISVFCTRYAGGIINQ